MEIDKRPRYVWAIVLIANLGTILVWIFALISETLRYYNDNPSQYIIENTFNVQFLITLFISVLLSVVPVLISKSNNKLVRSLGYGIPILFLLPIPYFIYDYYTCTGKFCDLGAAILGWGCALIAIIISAFYTIGNKVSKWSNRTYVSLLCAELVLILGIIIFIMYPVLTR